MTNFNRIHITIYIYIYIYIFREEVSVEDIPEQYKQETEDRRRDLIGIIHTKEKH